MQDGQAQAVDPREIMAREPLRWQQKVAIAICVLLNGLDGFDVLSISFASPGIAEDWNVTRGALGIVLSMELVGMAAGSFILGPVADRMGRKPTAIMCLIVMTIGMFSASMVNSIEALAAFRLLTGVGIGGMLACTNAMVAEFANDKWRAASVAIMAAGYPAGAILGGSFASYLLIDGTWRDIFVFGGFASAAALPLLFFLVPESVNYLVEQDRPDTLARVNKALKGFGHNAIAALKPVDTTRRAKVSIARLFEGDLRRTTILLTCGYFFHVMTFYFILKWIPVIVVDMGFEPASAGSVLVWANVGGLAGALLFGLAAVRIGLRHLMLGVLFFSTVMVVVFGMGQETIPGISTAAASTGFFTNASIVGFYALIAASFPTEARAGGTGFVIGVGRGGAALGPIIAGYLFEWNFGLQVVALAMAVGSLIAMFAVFGLPKDGTRAVAKN